MSEQTNSATTGHANSALAERGPITAFIRIARVKQISGLSKSTLHRWIAAGKFPRPVLRDGPTVAWDLAEVLRWRADKFRERDERAKAGGNQE